MSIPLKTILNIIVALEAALAFFMAREGIGPVYSMVFLAFMLAAFLIDRRGMHPPRIFINLATSAALLAIFTRVRRNYIVEALMEAILLMTVVKMLEDKRSRDYAQIAALGLAAVVSYAMMSVEKTFLLYSVGMALAVTMILLLSTWFDKDERAAASPRELRQIFTRAGAIFCFMSPLCLLIFFGMPRVASPIFGMRGSYSNSVTGFSDQVSLGDSSSIQTSGRLAFRAEMEQVESTTSLYWRGVVLDFLDGGTWISARRASGRGPFEPDPNARRVEQEIFLEPGNRGYLFALDQPISVTGQDVRSDGDGTFRYRGRGVGRRLQYSAVSAISSRMTPSSRQINRRRHLALPYNFMPRLAALVADITQGRNDGEKVSEVMRYLASPEFTYSLDQLPSGRDALERFIFESKKGNCEYYASAMGVMLRMAGVPARLVTGYRGGTYNDAGGYYIVQEHNAHIWVEVWDDAAAAWVRYDPTPAGVAGSDEMNTLELYLDFIDYQWSKMVVNYSLETQIDVVRNLREVISNPRESLTPTRDGFQRIGEALSAPAAVLAALMVCAALFYGVRSIRNRRPEIALLNEFLRVMKRRGYRKHDSEGLSEFLERVDDVSLRAAAAPFARGFEELFFKDAKIDAAACKRLRERIIGIQGKGRA